MTIEQDGAAEALQQLLELLFDRAVVGSVRLFEPIVELLGGDRTPPQEAVLLRARRHDPQSSPSPRRNPAAAGAIDGRGVDLILSPVAIDRGARRPRDDRAKAMPQRAPDEAVDVRILERREGWTAAGRHLHQPQGIVAARMRHRQQHGQIAAGRVNDWGEQRCHG